MTSPTNRDTKPAGRTSSDIAAMVSFLASLVFPVALVLNAIHVVIYSFTVGRSRPFPFLALIYTALDYYAVPVIIFAILVGHVALIRAGAWGQFARRGLAIAYVSLAGLALLFAALIGASSFHTSH